MPDRVEAVVRDGKRIAAGVLEGRGFFRDEVSRDRGDLFARQRLAMQASDVTTHGNHPKDEKVKGWGGGTTGHRKAAAPSLAGG